MGEAPVVLNIPWQERIDWGLHIGARFVRQIFTSMPLAAWQAIRHRPRKHIDDSRFNTLMTSSAYEKFLTPTLDPQDETDFATYLGDGATYFKSVFSAIEGVTPYRKMYVAPTTCLIREDGTERRVVAIRIGDLVVDPTHTNAWTTAKYFVLQGAAYGMLFTEHPNLHFPYDSINAITKSAVPIGHPIFQMLYPHLRFELQLNKAVLESKGSVITDWRPTLYAPFTADMSDGLLDLFVAGYHGVEGESGYPKYTFRKRPKKVYGDYGVFLDAYYEPVLKFAKAVAATIHDGDEYTRRWATYISGWVPGFPSAPEIFEGDNLAEVLAGIVWDLSIGHSVDHQAFSFDVSVEEKFLRLRVPPPTSLDAPAIEPGQVTRWVDRFKARVAHRVFFQPYTVTRLVDVQYGFENAALQNAGRQFIDDLKATEANLTVRNFMPLRTISASIQF